MFEKQNLWQSTNIWVDIKKSNLHITYEEVKTRLYSGNACYLLVQNAISSLLMP